MNKELLKKAQDSLAIDDVYLRESQAAINPEFDPKFTHENLQLQYKLTPSQISQIEVESSDGKKENVIRIETKTAMRLIASGVEQEALVKPEEAQKHVKVQITAVFIAEYRLINGDIEREAIDEFAKYNVGYHVWPYWREFVQNLCSRMLLPNIVLPMYSRNPSKKKDQQVSSATATNAEKADT